MGLPHVTEDLQEADGVIDSFDAPNRNMIIGYLNGGITDDENS